MQMIEVMKRLAELDNANGGIKESTKLVKDPAIAMISEGQQIDECGPMGMPGMEGGMPSSHPASFSINATASSGDEVANMLTQIMTLAGVKSHGDMGDMGEKEPLNAEPPMSAGDDMKAAISAIDQAEQETSMIGDMSPEMEDESEPDFEMGTAGPSGDVGAMADEVQDMADQLAGTDKEQLGLESLRQFDNSPQEQTRKTDPLNDFAAILNKVREFEYTPPNSGSNPMKAESVEAPAQESTGLLDLTNNLFKEYQAYKAQ